MGWGTNNNWMDISSLPSFELYFFKIFTKWLVYLCFLGVKNVNFKVTSALCGALALERVGEIKSQKIQKGGILILQM